MNFLCSYVTDKGRVKNINQDSLCIKEAVCEKHGKILMAAVCDGMGGFSAGEIASGSVIKALSDWFEMKLPLLILSKDNFLNDIEKEWHELASEYDYKTINYGLKNNFKLGTTATVILFTEKYGGIIMQIGDSRAYQICADDIKVMTWDQSKVGELMKAGKITEEEANNHNQRNILTQCIGGSRIGVKPDFYYFQIKNNCNYMLCSDGFRRVISKSEIYNYLNPVNTPSENAIEKNLKDLLKLNMDRKETDNITALVIKTID
ncbi:MAG: protein phosphatase 2C domain-containing protein [Ruminococcus sp.]|nr:protein phosphatase 2C domain-containing protein [Ruminococcus sp.]